uniref:Uncharacterized protein n=1 Tax=Caenorhabditis japonica TaxID=281687 RepID=A0A8R1DJV8_CAEJA
MTSSRMGTVPILNHTECKEAAETVRNGFYLVPSFLNTVSAVGTFGIFWLIYVHFSFRIYYHVNAKILIFINMLSFLIFSLATLFSYGTLFVNAILADQDCDFFFFTHNCSLLRRMFLFSIMLTTLTHISLVTERAYATYMLGAYEGKGPKIGAALGTLSICMAVMIVALVTGKEDSAERVTNCFAFSSSKAIGDNVYNMFRFQLVLEILTWIIYWFLMDYHSRKVRQQIEGHLSDRFQAMENMIVLRQLGPLILISSAIIGIYIVFSSTGRFFRDAFPLPRYKQFASFIFIMPHNAFLSMYMYYFLFKRGLEEKKKRMEETLTSPITQRKPYMEHLREYWNEHYPKRETKETPLVSSKSSEV